MKFSVFIEFLLSASCFPFIHGTGLSYNYFDQMSQTYCQGRLVPEWVFAIRRECDGIAPTRNDICASTKTDILGSIGFLKNIVACLDTINIKKDRVQLAVNPTGFQPDAGKASTVTYGYGAGGCTWTPNHCAPNYCCCKAY